MATNFPSVTIQGNVLTFDSLQQIALGKESGNMPRQSARDYGFSSEEALRTEIQRAWADALDQYGIFQRQLERLEAGATGVSETRSRWLLPFFYGLGYELQYAKAQLIDERTYAISHALTNEEHRDFPLHLVGARQSLDRKANGMRLSPHALVQEYLNRHENLYAIVSNGKFLRLLRDSSNLTKLSYVEFDLTRMFEEKLFPDFALLFRLLHLSRLPTEPSAGDDSILEKYHQEGLKSGSRIRENLSKAVEHGILQLGTGLLQDQENQALRNWVEEQGDQAPRQYYNHLLKLIYRLLFVMVIEERDLIFPAVDMGAAAGAGVTGSEQSESANKATDRQRRIYYDYYALARLRRLATTYQLAGERQYDLWDSLMNTFALFEDRGIGEKLGIAPLAGGLFGTDALGPLSGCRLNNRRLLESLRGLSQFTDAATGTVQIVNYASLDVEEFGSVYEGLLEYDPEIDLKARVFRFVEGQDRSSSGSHYTPDELVQPLIQHSLEHLITDRTVAPDASQEKRDAARQKLLQLKVADVACGSGHILLAAARRIGLELARLASGAEQPSPPEIRAGTREAIQNCIYGVDKNPLAVELCQVALWLEAHQPGQPLNFLEHRIRCGDAIVGVGRLEDLRRGIPTEAFKNYPGDSDQAKENGKALRKRNKEERKVREAGGGSLSLFNQLDTVEDQLAAFQQRYDEFATLPETTPAEIEAKAKAYKKLTSGGNWWFIKTLADVQTAQFFLSLDDEAKVVTDATFFEMLGGAHRQSQAAAAATGVSAERRFLHWFLEFPEVFAQGGFDCVVGNPPFLGNRKISGDFGSGYLTYLIAKYDPIGSVDLVTYFFRRIFNVLKAGGFQSLISTNTIAQGDARAGGLAVIRNQGGTINHAVRSMRWPGVAAVEVALVTIFKGDWQKPLVLNQTEVAQITTYLDDQEYLGDPYRLKQNAGKSFQGSIVLGKGFVLEPEQAAALIEKDPKNKDVLFPYLNGSDLNSRPDQSPSRWVINFFDWPERRLAPEEWQALAPEEREEIKRHITAEKTVEVAPPNYNQPVAMDYPDCYAIVEREVKPERQRWKIDKKKKKEIVGTYALRKPLPERWWMYADKRPALYRTIAGMERVLVVPLVSKYSTFNFTESSYVYMHKLGVFAVTDFGLLAGSIHNVWAWKYSSTLGSSTLNYSNSDVFETFPYPQGLLELQSLGRVYEIHQGKTTISLHFGLTKLYNQFHNAHLLTDYDDLWENDILTDPKKLKARKQSQETYNLWRHLDKTEGTIGMGEAVERIVELRQLHKEMDEAVLAAYGWHVNTRRWGPAIRLRHDFYEVDYLPEQDNVRYTIHPDARREVLKRLLLLNHEIHAAEERGVDYAVIDGEKIEALLIEQLRAWCPRADGLHWKTRKFLCTGEDLLPNLTHSLTKSYKPFVTAYASGLEAELQHKIFVEWNKEFQSRWGLDDGSREAYLAEQAAIDGKLRLFTGMLKKDEVNYTLGNMQFILNLVKTTKGNTIGSSSLLQDFRAFVVSRYGEAVLDKAFLGRVSAFVKAYRNEAAHTGEINKAQAETCRDEVRELVTVLVENERE